ncbi:TPA: hypothetical protein ACJFU4_005103, partial [Escherichia coli]
MHLQVLAHPWLPAQPFAYFFYTENTITKMLLYAKIKLLPTPPIKHILFFKIAYISQVPKTIS